MSPAAEEPLRSSAGCRRSGGRVSDVKLEQVSGHVLNRLVQRLACHENDCMLNPIGGSGEFAEIGFGEFGSGGSECGCQCGGFAGVRVAAEPGEECHAAQHDECVHFLNIGGRQ